jgi:hypothetical protein
MLFCGEKWVNFKRNTAYISVFSIVRNMMFVQNGPLLVNGRSTESLVIKLSVLEAGWPHIMFPWECSVIFWKEYCPPLRNFQYGQTHVSYEQYKLCWTEKCLSHCFPMRNEFPLERNSESLRVLKCEWCKRRPAEEFQLLRDLSLLWKRKWRHCHTEEVIKMLCAENLIVEKRRASLHISKCRGLGKPVI